MSQQEQDCAVCLQKCHHPTQLPCGHIFCFLCVKVGDFSNHGVCLHTGVAIQSRKCAMCRAEIPPDYLDHPILLEKSSPQLLTTDEFQVEYQWYYEGRNGWWKYDERSNVDLETAFNNHGGECTLLLAGALYSIDFQSMTQVKCTDRTRRRHVRRDTPLFPAKGIAGIKTENSNTQPTKSDDSITSNQSENEVIALVDVDDDSDDDVQILTVDPEVIEIDDINDNFERINIMNSSDPPEPSRQERT